MKLVFMGTPDFAAATLKALYEAGHEIAAVVTQPDRPVGRHHELKAPEVKSLALRLGIEKILQPETPSEPGFLEELKALSPEVIVVTAYGRILKKEILELPRYGCINVHASLLPRWRGAAPIQWALIAGDEKTGVTAMQMNEGLDTGDILLTKEIVPAPDETGGSLFDKLSVLGGELITETLAGLAEGRLKPVPQDSAGACYAPILNRETGRLDFTRPAAELERLIRGLTPWPGTYTRLGGRLLKIHRARPAGFPAGAGKAPGEICVLDGHIYTICGGGTVLEILELQPEGKKRLGAAEFLRGNVLEGVFES